MRNIILKEKAEPGLEIFIEEFIEDRFIDLEKLNSALKKASYKEVKDIAHRLKGFCGPYGFNLLEEFSIKLEAAALKENNEEVCKYIESITDYLILKKEILINEKL